ncbi:hypothetical protein SprV_0100311500 [Sparganum proliferum]
MDLKINSVAWKDLTQDRSAWRTAAKTEAAVYDANRVTVTKAKGAPRKSQALRALNLNTPPLPAYLRCQRHSTHGSVSSATFGPNVATTTPPTVSENATAVTSAANPNHAHDDDDCQHHSAKTNCLATVRHLHHHRHNPRGDD